MRTTITLLAGAATVASGRMMVQDRPIMKVVRMLQDMEAELKAELKDDKEVHETLTCWCNTNRKDKTAAIEMATAKIAQLEASMAEAIAKIAELKEKRAATLAEVNADHKALSEASALRMKENKQFQAEETDLIEAIKASKQAVTALSKHHPELAQVRAVAQQLEKARVPELIKASHPLRVEDMEALKGFLAQASGSMSFLEIPGMKSYAPQSGQIFGILKQMQEDFEATLGDSQKAEAKAVSDYQSLKAAKEEEIAAGKAAIDQFDMDIADTTEKHAVAMQEHEDTSAQLALDQTFLAALEEKCAKSAADFDQRVKDRLEEIAAVEDTIKILNSDSAFENFGKTVTDPNSAGFVAGTALLQLSSGAEQKLRESASAVLQRAASAYSNPKMALLAASAGLDAFTQVKADIDKLVAEYQQQQKDEIEQRDWCIKELNTNERDTAAADDKASGLQAKIADLTKTIEGLTADLKATADANAEMQTQMKRASETREGESAGNRQTVDDQRMTQMILTKAIDRMMATYQADKASIAKLTATLLQNQAAPHTQTSATHTDPGNGPAAFANNAKQNSGGDRVIAMLEEVSADSKKTEEETIASEEDSQTAYENFMKDSNKSIQRNLESITNMEEAKAKANDSLIQAKTDLKQTVAELGALHETNGDLHKSCDFVLANFDARQAARQAEIEAMKEAKNILSGMK